MNGLTNAYLPRSFCLLYYLFSTYLRFDRRIIRLVVATATSVFLTTIWAQGLPLAQLTAPPLTSLKDEDSASSWLSQRQWRISTRCLEYRRLPKETLQEQARRLEVLLHEGLNAELASDSGLAGGQSVLGCEFHAPLLAELGYLLNQQGRYVEAADYLERALLLDQSIKSAQIDYAFALAGMGDVPSALAWLDDLTADQALPRDLAPGLEAARLELARGQWLSRTQWAVRLGRDSNLLGAPNLSGLTLTLPGQSLTLGLDSSYLAQSGYYGRGDFAVEARRLDLDGQRYEVFANARLRAVPELDQANYHQYEVLAEWAGPWRIFSGDRMASMRPQRYINGGMMAFQALGGRAWYHAQSLGSGAQLHGRSNCQARLGGETQRRSYTGQSILDGQFWGLQVVWACQTQWQHQTLVRIGQDWAQSSERPGGDQRQWSVRQILVAPIQHLSGKVLIDWEFAVSRDQRGYSDLLDAGAVRAIRRVSSRLEYQYPLSKTVQGFAGYEWLRQRSNLSLFGLQNQGVYLGLRWIY